MRPAGFLSETLRTLSTFFNTNFKPSESFLTRNWLLDPTAFVAPDRWTPVGTEGIAQRSAIPLFWLWWLIESQSQRRRGSFEAVPHANRDARLFDHLLPVETRSVARSQRPDLAAANQSRWCIALLGDAFWTHENFLRPAFVHGFSHRRVFGCCWTIWQISQKSSS
jgi:hypothetical protein